VGLAKNLEAAGYRVYGAANGQDALQICNSQAIQVALLEAHFADIDGYTLCMKLCKERHVPVIFVTEANGADDMLQGFAAGASAFVSKPFGFRELSAQIQQTLRMEH
jgi:two-component system cell cycle response regulator